MPVIVPTVTRPAAPKPAPVLASTGLRDGWLIWVGILLLLVGGGVLAFTRFARRRS
jgi:LPXTG-motif cell wall-anchored protein